MNDLRVLLEKMTIDIKNFMLDTVKKDLRSAYQRNVFDEPLEPGQIVYAYDPNKKLCTKRSVVKSTSKDVTLEPIEGGD